MRKEWANPISEKSKRQGNLLRNIREAAGLTMRQLAMQIGISHTAISQLEHGKLDLPYARIEQLVTACGQTMADYEKIMGKSFVTPNYRDECISIVKVLDDQAVVHLYQLLSRLSPNPNGTIEAGKP